MAKKGFRISKEIKEETLNRIKNDGISVSQAAQDVGVSTVTIYSWLGNKARGFQLVFCNTTNLRKRMMS